MQMPTPSPAPHTRRLISDIDGERQAAALRIMAAVLAMLSGVWLLTVSDGWLLRITGGVSVLFALLWASSVLRRTPRKHGRADQPEQRDYLDIGRHDLVLVQDGLARSIPFSSMRSVAIDEDRLMVVLTLQDGEQLSLESSYRGVGLQELARLVHDAAFAKPKDASAEIMATMAGDE